MDLLSKKINYFLITSLALSANTVAAASLTAKSANILVHFRYQQPCINLCKQSLTSCTWYVRYAIYEVVFLFVTDGHGICLYMILLDCVWLFLSILVSLHVLFPKPLQLPNDDEVTSFHAQLAWRLYPWSISPLATGLKSNSLRAELCIYDNYLFNTFDISKQTLTIPVTLFSFAMEHWREELENVFLPPPVFLEAEFGWTTVCFVWHRELPLLYHS